MVVRFVVALLFVVEDGALVTFELFTLVALLLLFPGAVLVVVEVALPSAAFNSLFVVADFPVAFDFPPAVAFIPAPPDFVALLRVV